MILFCRYARSHSCMLSGCTTPPESPPPLVLLKVVRDKGVLKPASGTRKCNCKNRVVTNQVGPGMYQQYTTQVVKGECVGLVGGEGRTSQWLPSAGPTLFKTPCVQALESWFILQHHPQRRPPTRQVCEDCPNVKIVREREEVTVSVEPGTPDGHRITFFEEGG